MPSFKYESDKVEAEKGEMEELPVIGPEAEDHKQNFTVRSVSRDSSCSEKIFVIFIDRNMLD